MKLISLTITPNGNPIEEIAEIVIDHDPTVFKSRYVVLSMRSDDSRYLKSQPLMITEPQL